MNTTLFVIATITANPGHSQSVRKAIELIVPPTRAEDGCIRYDFLADNNNDHGFVIQEQWQSKAALDAHMLTAHFKVLVESIGSIANINVSEFSLQA